MIHGHVLWLNDCSVWQYHLAQYQDKRRLVWQHKRRLVLQHERRLVLQHCCQTTSLRLYSYFLSSDNQNYPSLFLMSFSAHRGQNFKHSTQIVPVYKISSDLRSSVNGRLVKELSANTSWFSRFGDVGNRFATTLSLTPKVVFVHLRIIKESTNTATPPNFKLSFMGFIWKILIKVTPHLEWNHNIVYRIKLFRIHLPDLCRVAMV